MGNQHARTFVVVVGEQLEEAHICETEIVCQVFVLDGPWSELYRSQLSLSH